MNQKLKKQFSILIVFVSIILIFQNCAEPLQMNEESAASKADIYPFGFETKIDTFSYMSCAGFDNSVFNSRAIYTFKSGGYESGSGIGLSQTFLEAVGPNARLTQQEQYLAEGIQNRGAQIQAAIRARSNLLQFYVSETSGQGTEGVDYQNVLAPLDSVDLLRPIVSAKGQKIQYFSNLPGVEERRLESYLYFNGSEEMARDLRSRIHNGELIYSLGYTDVDSEHPLTPMAPAGQDGKQAYGMGLRFIFAKGHGINNVTGAILPFTGSAEARVLQSAKEVDLLKPGVEKTSSEANWVCPDNLRFMIVMPEDNDAVLCGVTSAGQLILWFFEDPNSPPAGLSSAEYRAVRNILPVEYWHIDFAKRCIITKESEDRCYDQSLDKEINYFNGSNSYPTSCGTGETDEYQCPHYVSVCFKQ
jgi:hypothetical protein